jgi:hypothetical protein
MICTLAVYSKEAAVALDLLAWINELGGVQRHGLVLATTPMVDPRPLLAEARQGWGSVEHFTMKAEGTTWPLGNNMNFLEVATFMNDRGRPFLFLEADVLPLTPDWLDRLEAEYIESAKLFMGDVHLMTDGENKPIEGSEHMNGAGIYPARVLTYLPSAKWIVVGTGHEPWDVTLRFETQSLVDGAGGFRMDRGERISVCHPTRQICFCWKSYRYRVLPDGSWDCDTEPRALHRKIDFHRHVVHHGCKDGSLLTLLRARLRGTQTQPEGGAVKDDPGTSGHQPADHAGEVVSTATADAAPPLTSGSGVEESPRKERCKFCLEMVEDWVEPNWVKGRVCLRCEALHAAIHAPAAPARREKSSARRPVHQVALRKGGRRAAAAPAAPAPAATAIT